MGLVLPQSALPAMTPCMLCPSFKLLSPTGSLRAAELQVTTQWGGWVSFVRWCQKNLDSETVFPLAE